MQQLLERKTDGQEKLLAVGSVRKDKELRQLQGECELLKADIARLTKENEMVKSENRRLEEKDREIERHTNLPLSPENIFREENEAEEEKERPADLINEEKKEEEIELAESLGSDTLKSSLSELTKSQKIIVENVNEVYIMC